MSYLNLYILGSYRHFTFRLDLVSLKKMASLVSLTSRFWMTWDLLFLFLFFLHFSRPCILPTGERPSWQIAQPQFFKPLSDCHLLSTLKFLPPLCYSPAQVVYCLLSFFPCYDGIPSPDASGRLRNYLLKPRRHTRTTCV